MPWTAADADAHSKGLTDKQKKVWANVANSALRRCEADGGSDCEGSAIRQANAAAKKAKAAEAIGEAATIRHRARALVRDLDTILSDKGLTDEARAPLLDLRSQLGRTWAEILADQAPNDGGIEEALVARIMVEASMILAQDDSWDGRRMLVQQALIARERAESEGGQDPYGYGGGYGEIPYIEEMYDDTVVYCCYGTLYACAYSLGGDDEVTLGDPQEVERAYVGVTGSDASASNEAANEEADPPPYKRKKKARPGQKPYKHAGYRESIPHHIESDLVPLIEAGVRADGTVPIRIIQPGWGSSGYYPPDVLERDGPQVFPKGTHMYLDHPTVQEDAQRPERSLKDLVAVLDSTPKYEAEHPAGPGLYADARVFEPFRTLIGELAPHIGTSIRAQGRTAEGKADGRAGPIVQELMQGLSVDFVTAAGAGGKVLEIVESARHRPAPAPPPAPTPAPREGGTVVTEAEAKALREQSERLSAELTETRSRLARMEEATLLREALDIAASTLAPIRMAEMTRERLLGTVALNPPVAEADGVRKIDRPAFVARIKEAAAEEIAYIAKATGQGSGQVVGLGSAAPVEVTEADAEADLAAAFGSFLGESTGKIAATGR